MMRNQMALGVWLVVVTVVHGCRKDRPSPPAPEISVTLVAPGDEPRDVLRYRIAADTQVHSVLEVTTSATTTEDVEDTFGVLPGVKLKLHGGPTLPLDEDGFRYVLRISRADPVLPEGTEIHHVEHVEESVRALNDTRGRYDLNDRGIVVDSDVPWTVGQERINPRVTIMLSNVRSAIATIPLPVEPVGIGAVWEVRREVRIWSARVTQTTRYELVDRMDAQLRVRIAVRQSAPPQIADLNPKLEMHVRAFEMEASGHALVDLGLPIALEADLESHAEADIALVSPEATEPIQSSRVSMLRLTTESER